MGFVQHQAEGGEQLQSFSKISKDSRSQNVDKDELLKKSKASEINTIRSRKNGKNVEGRERKKSSTSHLKKRQPEISPPKTTENGNKVLSYLYKCHVLYAFLCLRSTIAA